MLSSKPCTYLEVGLIVALISMAFAYERLDNERERLVEVAGTELANRWMEHPETYPYHFNFRPPYRLPNWVGE